MSVKGLVLMLFGIGCIFLVESKHVWYEQPPDPEDPCTIVVVATNNTVWYEIHPPANCDHGGLIMYGTWGKVHAWLYTDPELKEDFEVCLTAGEAFSIIVNWNYYNKYWEMMQFKTYLDGEFVWTDNCRMSLDGQMDLFFTPFHYRLHYVSHVSWAVRPKPENWVDPIDRSKKTPFEKDEDDDDNDGDDDFEDLS